MRVKFKLIQSCNRHVNIKFCVPSSLGFQLELLRVKKTYKPANEHAIKLGKLIEELSSLEMDGNKNEKKISTLFLLNPQKGKG